MKKMSTPVVRRMRNWIAPVAIAGSLLASSLVGEPAPTLKDSPTRLSSNENAFGYTPKAKAAMIKALESGSYYNWNNIGDLVKALGEYEDVPNDYILTTAGSGPLLMMTALAYAEPGANVVTSAMGYTQLVRKFEARGGDVKYVPLSDEMGYDLKALGAAIDENTKIVYICNPNNPTGVLVDSFELKQFVLSVPPDVLVFVDEAYLELIDGDFSMATVAPLTKVRKNLIVTRTFSKGFGMAGLRVGWGIAHPEVLEKIKVFHMGNPSYLSAIAALEALKDKEFFQSNVDNYKKNRQYLTDAFDDRGIKYAEPNGAFVYFYTGIDTQELRDTMSANGLLISGNRVSGAAEEDYAGWARVSIGTKPQLDDFLDILGSAMAEN